MGLAADLGVIVRTPRLPGRVVAAVASTRPGAWFFARTLHHVDRAVLSLSRGRVTLTDVLAELPAVLLTTVGARSGLPRTVPLVAVPAGEHLAVIGSNFGGHRHPGWVHNLLAEPRASLAREGRVVAVRAREATGAEAEQIWARARAMYRGYSSYPQRTAGRVIRVFVLEPDAGS